MFKPTSASCLLAVLVVLLAFCSSIGWAKVKCYNCEPNGWIPRANVTSCSQTGNSSCESCEIQYTTTKASSVMCSQQVLNQTQTTQCATTLVEGKNETVCTKFCAKDLCNASSAFSLFASYLLTPALILLSLAAVRNNF